jgi:tetratricopeptide (TPR) repeat protein
LGVKTTIEGGFALTRLEFAITNPSNTPRGGNLIVPLTSDSMIVGSQLDVNGVLIDAVPVEKIKAKQAYEAIQRQGIDPGLVEHAQGNAFRTRVFPVPPKGTRHVSVTYLAPLGGPDLKEYQLPLLLGVTVDQFSLDVTILDQGARPTVRIQGFEKETFAPLKRGWNLNLQKTAVLLDTTVQISLPKSGLSLPTIQDYENQTWFSVVLPNPKPIQNQLPSRNITLYVDASLSMASEKHDHLVQALQALATGHNQTLSIEVIAFRDQSQPSASLEIRPNDASELRRYLATLAWDGATRFDNLPAPKRGNFVIFYTDAKPTLGQALPSWPKPKHSALMSPSSHGDGHFARRLLGPTAPYIDLTLGNADSHSKALLANHSLVEVNTSQGKASSLRVQPLIGRPEFSVVSGILGSDQVVLNPKELSPISINVKQLTSGQVARFAWAQAQLDELLGRSDYGQESWKADIRSFGLEYGIVTPGTSLMVLESLAQYIEYGIMPPASMPKWRQAYLTNQTDKENQIRSDETGRLNKLALQWHERIEWWKKDKRNEVWKRGGRDKDDSVATGSAPQPSRRAQHSSMAATAPESYAMSDEASPRDGAVAAKEATEPEAEGPTITIQAWDPKRPYLKPLEGLNAQGAYKKYLEIRESYKGSPAFFFDMGDFFYNKLKSPELATRIWSNLAELGFNDPAVLRVLGYRLTYAQNLDLAKKVFEIVKEERPDQPQSYRDLALAYARLGQYKESAELLWTVVKGQWNRTAGIELIALMELNRYLPEARKQGWKQAIDPRLVAFLDLDIRVSLAWDADMTDMDLWVTEPSGFKVNYSQKNSPHGGMISRDITDGYGPEEYLLHWAKKGKYKVQANYYGSNSPDLTGGVSVFLTVWTNYGRRNEQRQDIAIQLDQKKETYNVGDVAW